MGTPPLILAAPAAASAPPRLTFLTSALPDGVLTPSSPGSVPSGADGAASRRSESPALLVDLLAGADDVVSWVREGRGLVGTGRVLVLEDGGPDRIENLRSAWRSVVYASWWSDPLVRPGTGPVALGAITFAPGSRMRSALVVPEVLVGLDDAGAWVTTAHLSAEDRPTGAVGSPAARAIVQGAVPEEAAGAHARAFERVLNLAAAARGRAVPEAPGCAVEPGALSDERYLAAVRETCRRMRAGEARKVVLARDVLARPERPVATGDLLARLAAAYPSCWTFAVDGIAGASPELLVRLEGRRLASRVLAGTARRHAGTPEERRAEAERLAEWLRSSEKNNREHALARASAITALEPLCSVVESPEPFILTLPNVLHLASDVSGVVAGDTGALSLVGALHPTAAVCGTPTAAAARVIDEVEGMDRGRYAGPVGWVDWHGEGEWCIALRSTELSEGGAGPDAPARVLGGGGIMPDSDPEDELAETRAKMSAVLGALGAA